MLFITRFLHITTLYYSNCYCLVLPTWLLEWPGGGEGAPEEWGRGRVHGLQVSSSRRPHQVHLLPETRPVPAGLPSHNGGFNSLV